MRDIVHVVILFGCAPIVASSWNSEELALYDLVEEVNQNFYELFGITKDASTQEIKKAYRRLSLEWHPDRNSAPNAAAKFRQIAAIYEALKSSELREKYNNVLEFGLPDWRQPIYYYRKMRKLAWYEAVFVLLTVSTIAHYFMMWATYYEKYLVLSQNLRKSRKREKKGEPEGLKIQLREALDMYRPKFYGLLPFLLARGSWGLFTTLVMTLQEYMARRESVIEDEVDEPKRPTPVPRAPEFEYEMATDLKAVSTNNPELQAKYLSELEQSSRKQAGGAWTSEELYQLVRLTTEKFPPGTPNRWECMARVLNRSAQDITTMAAKLKQMRQEEYAKLAMGQQSVSIIETHKEKQQSLSEKSLVPEWTQLEQKQFEAALQQYPKGCEDRWDKIANAVPTKSKEQCQQRLKELVELVKRKKANTQNKD